MADKAVSDGRPVLMVAALESTLARTERALAKLDDFKGVRIRYAGAQNRSLYEAMGATPLLIAPPESQDSLAKGIIDAATFPYEGAASFGGGEVQPMVNRTRGRDLVAWTEPYGDPQATAARSRL